MDDVNAKILESLKEQREGEHDMIIVFKLVEIA